MYAVPTSWGTEGPYLSEFMHSVFKSVTYPNFSQALTRESMPILYLGVLIMEYGRSLNQYNFFKTLKILCNI